MVLFMEEEARGLSGAGVWVGRHLGVSVLEALEKEVPC